MSDFFDSEIVREALQDIHEMQTEIYQSALRLELCLVKTKSNTLKINISFGKTTTNVYSH